MLLVLVFMLLVLVKKILGLEDVFNKQAKSNDNSR